jgi:small redox-active disulfide protein 2
MNIKVLGTGCSKCNSLEKSVKSALEELQMAVEVEKVDDIQKIIAYGIMMTPALVINEKVVIKGSVPSVKDLKEIILQNQ